MGIFSLFRLKGFNAEQFERELTTLTQQIGDKQQLINRLKNRQRKITEKLFNGAFAFYLVILAYYYQTTPTNPLFKNRLVNFIRMQDVGRYQFMIGFPLISYLVIIVLRFCIGTLMRKQEQLLDNLKKKHGTKIEELKKITNYEKTSNLLKKYSQEEKKRQEEPHRREPVTKSRTEVLAKPGAQGDTFHAQDSSRPLGQDRNLQQQTGVNWQHVQAFMQASTKKTAADKILDWVVGGDDSDAVDRKYALICKQCLSHNGLAPPGCENPFKIVYICPKCGFVNGDTGSVDETVFSNMFIPSPDIKAASAPQFENSKEQGEASDHDKRNLIANSMGSHFLPQSSAQPALSETSDH